MDDSKTASVAVAEQPLLVKGSTARDEAEMSRMGKTQQLQVCPLRLTTWHQLIAKLENIPFYQHRGICHHPAINMGERTAG